MRPFILKPIDEKNWRELFRCRVCGTYWRIDTGDKYQERFAWKIGEFREDWADMNFVDEEKRLLVEHRGGVSDEACIWAGCGKPRVKGVVFCVDHLYETGARK